MAVYDNWDSVRDFRHDQKISRRARENRTWKRTLAWFVAIMAIIIGAMYGMRPAHAATENVVVTCDGASGTAAAFVTMIRANGQELTQEQVTGKPVPRTGGEPWAWSFDWSFEGHQEVTIFDVTHDGAVTNLVGYFPVDCPLPTTTTQAPEPTVTVGLELQESTTVVLNTAPLPTLTYSGHEFYVAPTTLPEPVGCCSDWVGDTTASVPVATLPATGSTTGPMLGVGAVLLAVGVVALLTTRRA